MLEKNMTLSQMLEYAPQDVDMLSLPLEAVVYLKITVLSADEATNLELIKHLFTNEEASSYFYDLTNSNIYDFVVPNNAGFVNIVEVCGTCPYGEMSIYLKELLDNYDGDAECIIDLFTHDSNHYRYTYVDKMVGVQKVIGENKES